MIGLSWNEVCRVDFRVPFLKEYKNMLSTVHCRMVIDGFFPYSFIQQAFSGCLLHAKYCHR